MELEVAKMLVMLSIAMEDVSMFEWELLGKALVRIHEAEVGLRWVVVVAWEARVVAQVEVEQ